MQKLKSNWTWLKADFIDERIDKLNISFQFTKLLSFLTIKLSILLTYQ
jgi:hypothetical protein